MAPFERSFRLSSLLGICYQCVILLFDQLERHDEFEYKDNCDNLNEYDEVSDPCETVSETYPNEVVIVSADNFHCIIHGACHEQSEHIEEYGTRKPRSHPILE
ncbi:hypothetical protein J1N35_033481 [Gossypium stocksii]|uniref:Uncharacterized protein n=1 Tax=Gossypium stocksii TaxID=47602 RepID=A0A9D3ZNE0_9ROSI|nr:hypothetical protein J1N35_033481 [Gossypium stocksii]